MSENDAIVNARLVADKRQKNLRKCFVFPEYNAIICGVEDTKLFSIKTDSIGEGNII